MATQSSSEQSTGSQASTLQAHRAPDKVVLKKSCSVDGCSGIMQFHDANVEAAGPHTLEWPWYATWVCSAQPSHIEIVTNEDYAKIQRLRRERKRQPEYLDLASEPNLERPSALRRIARRIAALFGSNA